EERRLRPRVQVRGHRSPTIPAASDIDSGTRSVELDWESVEGDWVPPTEILRRETVPRLWTSYERVSPTVETVESDEEHGSAYISRRALGVLRDTAGEVEDEGGDFGEVRDVAERLVDARPSMSSLTNRVNRVMCPSETPEEVERAAHEEVKKSYERDSEAARRAGETVEGKSVLTLSRSGTVIDALTGSDVGSVVVAESRTRRCRGRRGTLRGGGRRHPDS
ncbi:MAG: hypothetical protein SV760_07520, partial [Halobacteria archaeon]|nr:hypothetical protein [Halobacteria archaeon]